jgi:CRP/FNR family transcriptional regulator
MNKPDLTAILAQVHFFQGLSKSSRQALAEVAIPRTVSREEILFRERESGHSVYLVNRGRVELIKRHSNGEDVVISVMRPGQIFAEIVLFEQDRYPVTARALTACHLYLFPRREIRKLLNDESFRNDFLAMMFAKQRHLTERILHSAGHDVEERFFLFLREQYGEATEIRMDLSKRAVAAAIRTTPETLSRLLARLAADQRVVWKGSKLIRS